MKIKEDKFSMLIENIQDGYAYHQIVRDSSGKPVDYIFIDVNPAFETIAGLNRIDILGKTVNEVIPVIKESGLDWIKIYKQLAHTEKPIQFESFSEPLNRWYEISVFSPEEGYFAAVFRDITEKKRATKILLDSETRYRRLFESARDGILILNADSGQIVDANPFLLERVGLSKEEILGKPIWKIGKFTYIFANKDRFLELQQKEYIRYEDLPLQTVDGREIAVEFVSNIYLEGQNKVIQCNIRDITERRKMENKLKTNLAKLEAIYTVSSALRTAETLDEMLTLLLGETLQVLDTEAGAICLYHPENEQLGFTATQGWFGGLDDTFLNPGDGFAGEVFALGKMLISKEYANDSRVKYTNKIPEGWGGVCLPLRSETNIVGTFFVAVQLPREISSEEIKLLSSLSEMAGTAIHRMGLYEKNLRHLEQVQALRNIDIAISDSQDLRLIFKVILDEVTRMLNVDAAAILRLDPHTGILKYEAWCGFRIVNPAKLSLGIGVGLAGKAALERKTIRKANPREIEGDPVQGPLMKKEDAHSYYAVPLIYKGRIEGVLEIFHREPLGANEEWLGFLETLAGQTAVAIDNAELVHNLANTNYKLIQAYDNTIKGWAYALDLRDKETEDHSLRVTETTVNIAREMGMSQEELVHVRRGALLHDIGKMSVSDTILLKPGKLTEKEWAIMHRHPIHAFEMLSSIEYLRPALDIPYCHHEKWDGTGYPRGLKRKEIPLAARIFAVVDVFDALTSDRPYRKAWSRKEAFKHICQESGSHFDPHVVEKFFEEVK